MLRHRVIPCLLLDDGNLVKTTRFRSAKYVGDPINAIRIFNEKEVDELILLDITATRMSRPPNFDLIEQIAGECFMPLTYGGGVTSIEQAQRLFSLGVEKICLQTGVLNELSLITNIAEKYGSQSVVVSIDVKKSYFRGYVRTSHAGQKVKNQDWKDYIYRVIKAGAGEIMLTAVDKDGTLSGMNLELIQQASTICSIPLIACGGASSLGDLKAAVRAGASAIAAGAMFIYQGPHRAVLLSYPDYQELISLLDN
ncbi:MAG: AglZ/HisF2 family acetamidino modification protein [Pigmentiphaga sp.]|uniref:AglZ/HisF2 family acetamidino modification protein n=1 Tax=Pigmentiphaga sp. TaxID=1977564 RepID=UPI003B574A58